MRALVFASVGAFASDEPANELFFLIHLVSRNAPEHTISPDRGQEDQDPDYCEDDAFGLGGL